MKWSQLCTVFILGVIYIVGCTDVPLSYNTVLSNKRLLGYWKGDDGSVVVFKTNNDGHTVVNNYNLSGGEYKQGIEETKIYFTDIVKNGVTHQFISAGNNSAGFTTFEFQVQPTGQLILNIIDENNSTRKNIMDNSIFESTDNFRKFVQANLDKPDFVARKIIYQKTTAELAFVNSNLKTQDQQTTKTSVSGDVNGTIAPQNTVSPNNEEINTDLEYAVILGLIKARMKTIVDNIHGWSEDKLKEITNSSISEVYPNGHIKSIKIDFVSGYTIWGNDNDWRGLRNKTVYVYCNAGLPIALYGDFSKPFDYHIFPYNSYYYSDEAKNANYKDFSENEKRLIDIYYKEFRKQVLQESPSYQAVLQKHNSYPKEYDIKNCLAIVHKKTQLLVIEKVLNPDYYNPSVNAIEKYKDGDWKIVDGKVKLIKNNSDHPVIIKGIYKKETAEGYVYIDNSILLAPGEVIAYFDIGKAFDDSDPWHNVQYFGDVGKLSVYE